MDLSTLSPHLGNSHSRYIWNLNLNSQFVLHLEVVVRAEIACSDDWYTANAFART